MDLNEIINKIDKKKVFKVSAIILLILTIMNVFLYKHEYMLILTGYISTFFLILFFLFASYIEISVLKDKKEREAKDYITMIVAAFIIIVCLSMSFFSFNAFVNKSIHYFFGDIVHEEEVYLVEIDKVRDGKGYDSVAVFSNGKRFKDYHYTIENALEVGERVKIRYIGEHYSTIINITVDGKWVNRK